MLKCTCDESKKYIFISYAHKDSEKVVPIVSRLMDEGFNVWYDEGIDPGTEWDENIAKHINECAYFIAFITSSYIDSKNCKDELNFSRDLDKEQLLVYLEDVELPMGMAMRMNRLQAIWWEKYSKNNYEDAFQKLFVAKGINATKVFESKVKPVEEKVEAPVNTEKASQDIDNPIPAKKKNSALKIALFIAIPVAVVILCFIICLSGILIVGSGTKKGKTSEPSVAYSYIHMDGKEYNPDKALETFTNEADSGNLDSSFMAAYILSVENTYMYNEDQRAAIEYYKECESENPFATLGIGVAYYYMDDTYNGDIYGKKAFSYINESSLLSENKPYIAEAFYLLGIAYNYGVGCEKDYIKSEQYYLKAIDNGCVAAYMDLAFLYFNNLQDVEKFTNILDKNAELKEIGFEKIDLVSANYMLWLYKEFKDDQNFLEFINICNNCGANKCYYGYRMLGRIYSDSIQYPDWYDMDKSNEYFKMAADMNDPWGYYYLGNNYMTIDDNDSDYPNYDKAKYYFELSRNDGCGLACYQLGQLSMRDHYNDCDFTEAADLFAEGAKLNNYDCYKMIGDFYYYGYALEGVNYDTAISYYHIALEGGSTKVYASLALAYDEGKGVEKDAEMAVNYYKLGADAGDIDCLIELAERYSGIKENAGVAIDMQKAQNYFEKLSSQRLITNDQIKRVNEIRRVLSEV